ncbi:N-acetyltransferase [Phaeovibrio sulfidiphilus]|uniref:N-acetyltransferase n=1 Tax=Phaeovibrio sulfidiphilus TaxID=1220600 RepID=A0A8J7CNY7_9PROT|nr:N-acetyltransferase [Phaeovibrio sulfidiphilus]MBE1236437.1 N-acetyltransferase [Phaeovibrio sulfidiphilus]
MVTVTLQTETPEFSGAIEALLDVAFGTDRHRKISYRYREAIAPVSSLCFTAHSEPGGALVGTVRNWPVFLVGGTGAPLNTILLGPIAIDPPLKALGIGGMLMRHAIAAARAQGVDMIVLVGDSAYYERFGFVSAGDFGIVMPDEAPHRVLALPLSAAAARSTRSGVLVRAESVSLPHVA